LTPPNECFTVLKLKTAGKFYQIQIIHIEHLYSTSEAHCKANPAIFYGYIPA